MNTANTDDDTRKQSLLGKERGSYRNSLGLTAAQKKAEKKFDLQVVKIKTVCSVIAAVYIWCLPLLWKWELTKGFTTDGRSVDGKAYSISMFISTTQATGAMAILFYSPILYMWEHPI